MSAEGGAGQPLVSVGIWVVLAFELVGGTGGDLLVVELAGDGVIAQAGGGGDQRLGQGRAVPAGVDEQGAAGAGRDAELVGAVVPDRVGARRPGVHGETVQGGLGGGARGTRPGRLVGGG